MLAGSGTLETGGGASMCGPEQLPDQAPVVTEIPPELNVGRSNPKAKRASSIVRWNAVMLANPGMSTDSPGFRVFPAR